MQRRTALSIVAIAARFVSGAINAWPLYVIAALLISPVGPHLRYSYMRDGNFYFRCTYVGARGFIRPDAAPDCPIIIITDARNWKE